MPISGSTRGSLARLWASPSTNCVSVDSWIEPCCWRAEAGAADSTTSSDATDARTRSGDFQRGLADDQRGQSHVDLDLHAIVAGREGRLVRIDRGDGNLSLRLWEHRHVGQ